MIYATGMRTPLGRLSIISDDRTWIETAKKELREYFKGRRKRFGVNIDIKNMSATPFQKKVWRALMKIPFGSTVTYSGLARMIGRPRAARAVGNACGKNPVPIIIPCHRAVAAGGSSGGFSCGVWRKKRLLAFELKHLNT